MNNKISQLQLISIGGCYLLGTIVISVFVSTIAQNESWLVGVMGGICFIPTLFIYFSLIKKYPGKSLFEMNEAVFGAAAGRILSFVYLLFFISLCALNILEACNFLYYFIMPDTPLFVIALFLVAASVYCMKKGFIAIARVSTFFGIIAIGGLLLSTLLSLYHTNLSYLLPVFNLRLMDYIQSVHIAAAIPYGESIFLLMLIPRLSEKASIRKVYVIITIFTAFIMTLVHFREVIALGPLIPFMTLPSFEAVRMINVGDVFLRIESVFALLLITLTFFKAMILFYISLKGIKQIFRLESHRHLILMLGAFLTIYAVGGRGSPNDIIYLGKNVSPFIWYFFTTLIPLFTLLAAALRQLFLRFRKKEVSK